MPIKVATWNTRGNPAGSREKMAVLQALLRSNHIVLLQECGGLTAADVGGRSLVVRGPAGAYHIRCSSAIISDRALDGVGEFTLPSSNGRACSFGSYYNDSLIIATLHANSHIDAVHDASGVLAEFSRRFVNPNLLVGGDFNAEPSDQSTGKTRSKTVGSSTRGEDFYVASPDGATHRCGRKLDYFIYNHNVRCENTTRYHTYGGSDHLPVMTEVVPRLRGG